MPGIFHTVYNYPRSERAQTEDRLQGSLRSSLPLPTAGWVVEGVNLGPALLLPPGQAYVDEEAHRIELVRSVLLMVARQDWVDPGGSLEEWSEYTEQRLASGRGNVVNKQVQLLQSASVGTPGGERRWTGRGDVRWYALQRCEEGRRLESVPAWTRQTAAESEMKHKNMVNCNLAVLVLTHKVRRFFRASPWGYSCYPSLSEHFLPVSGLDNQGGTSLWRHSSSPASSSGPQLSASTPTRAPGRSANKKQDVLL